MDNIIRLALEDSLVLILVFLFLFAGLVYVFMRERFLSTLAGFARVVVSLLYGPIIYLKNVLEELANYGSKGEKEFSHSRQYLLNKIFLALQVVIVLIFVLVIAGGILAGWNSFLPPKELRQAITRTEEGLEQNQLALEQLEPRIAQFERSWSSNRNALLADLQRNRQKKAQTWESENQQLAGAIEAVQEARSRFADLHSIHQRARWAYQKTPENYYQLFREARRSILGSGLPRDVMSQLHRYNENWYRLSMIQFEITQMPEDYVRALFQPAFATLKEEYDQLNAIILEQTQELTDMRSRAKLNFWNLFSEIGFGMLQALAFVWLAGLLVEALWLGVSLATDVHALRSRMEEQGNIK